jgi:hypothetical protein
MRHYTSYPNGRIYTVRDLLPAVGKVEVSDRFDIKNNQDG